MHLSSFTITLRSVHNIELTYLMMHSRAGSIARPTWSSSIALDGLVSASEFVGCRCGSRPDGGSRKGEEPGGRMDLRRLELGAGRVGVGLGTNNLGLKLIMADSSEVMHAAPDAAIILFDLIAF